MQMVEKFKTLFSVKSSLITLYLALTIPIPIMSIEELRIFSMIAFLFGMFLIVSITNDCLITCDEKVSYNSNFVSRIFGRKSWEISWKDIKLIKSCPTSQGSKVYYFITSNGESFLVPQRVEKFEKFISIISKKTNFEFGDLSYISPLWTYKLLTFLSIVMILGELFLFIKYYQY